METIQITQQVLDAIVDYNKTRPENSFKILNQSKFEEEISQAINELSGSMRNIFIKAFSLNDDMIKENLGKPFFHTITQEDRIEVLKQHWSENLKVKNSSDFTCYVSDTIRGVRNRLIIKNIAEGTWY